MNGRHRTFFVIGSFDSESGNHIAIRAGVRFGNVFSSTLSRPAPRTRLLLHRIALAGIFLAVFGIREAFKRTGWNAKEVRRTLTEEALLKTMAQWTLPLANSALGPARSHGSENEFFTEVGTL